MRSILSLFMFVMLAFVFSVSLILGIWGRLQSQTGLIP